MKDIRDAILSACIKTARCYAEEFNTSYYSLIDDALTKQYNGTLMCTDNHKYFMICMVVLPLGLTFTGHAYTAIWVIALLFMFECFRRRVIRCVISRHTYRKGAYDIKVKLSYNDTLISIISDGTKCFVIPFVAGENMFVANKMNIYYVLNLFDDDKLCDLQNTLAHVRYLMEVDFIQYYG